MICPGRRAPEIVPAESNGSQRKTHAIISQFKDIV